jgi:hypothetical protein
LLAAPAAWPGHRYMITEFQHELIVLPAAARAGIPARLQSAGIEVAPTVTKVPTKLKDLGVILTCTEDRGSAKIFIMDEASTPPEHRSMAAVLILPGRGGLADWLRGTTDRRLRHKIHEVLYAFKSEISAQQK